MFSKLFTITVLAFLVSTVLLLVGSGSIVQKMVSAAEYTDHKCDDKVTTSQSGGCTGNTKSKCESQTSVYTYSGSGTCISGYTGYKCTTYTLKEKKVCDCVWSSTNLDCAEEIICDTSGSDINTCFDNKA